MRRVIYIAGAISALMLSACLDEPKVEPEDNQCTITADCDVANGEVCDKGICWGNPPASLEFSALLVPPTGRDDIVPTEILSLDVASDGTLSNLVFGDYITVAGRVILACEDSTVPELCDPSVSTAATLFIRRPSRIVGGPRYTRTVEVIPAVGSGSKAFEIRLPRLQDGDAPYEITIKPSDAANAANGITPAMLAPPMRVEIDGTKDQLNEEWRLGNPEDHIIVAGRVLDAVGQGVSGLQVSAQGRWAPLGEVVDASSLATTDNDGIFTLYVPRDMVPFFELVVKPEPGTLKPTLRAFGVPIPAPKTPDTIVFVDDLRMPSHPEPVLFRLPVVGLDGTGTEIPVAGASIRVETTLSSDPGTEASYVAQGASGTDGVAELMLIPGSQNNRLYDARVISPPSSTLASNFDFDLPVGPYDGTNVLDKVTLEHRIAVSGVVTNNAGVPIEGASVNAVVGNGFKFALTLADQSKIENLQLPTVTTDVNGEFLLWLDPLLGNWEAGYDIEIVPPASSDAPHWSVNNVRFNQDDLGWINRDLNIVTLPEASYARGSIVTSDGETLANAEVRIYQISEEYSICETAEPRGGVECVPPARPRGVWQADDTGSVWLILPRQ